MSNTGYGGVPAAVPAQSHQLHSPHPKRRKLGPAVEHNSLDLHANGILTPLDDIEMDVHNPRQEHRPETHSQHTWYASPATELHVHSNDEMLLDTSYEGTECPCGYMHGPGQQHHDITAVGLSSNMMRGPD